MSWGNVFFLTVAWIAGCLLLRKWPCCTRTENPNRFDPVRISLIIPARNEEINLAGLLKSVSSQSCRAHEILVVNDHSEDRTAAVAVRFGAHVIESPPLPGGWTGKNWALHQGVQQARGDVFFFLDADTFFAVPHGFEKVRDTFLRSGGAVSVQPYHLPRDWIEQLSAFFNLIMAAATRGGFWGKSDSGLVGPSLIISRADYERLGGHRSVKGRVLENLHLGQRARKIKMRCQTFNGKGALNYRMYSGGIGDLVRGWSKAYFHGMTRVPWKVLALVFVWLVGMARTARLFACSWIDDSLDPWFCGMAYAFFAGQSFLLFNEVGRFRVLTSLFYPVGYLFFLAMFLISIAMKSLGIKPGWKGRRVPGSSRKSP